MTDRVLGGEMAGIPGTGGDVLHAHLGVFLVPDFVQAILVEQHRHIERIAAAEREIPAKHRDLGW